MQKRSYYDPKPVGNLQMLFRYWAHLRVYTFTMKLRLDHLIEIDAIEIDPPLPAGWQVQSANYNYDIKVPEEASRQYINGWYPASEHRYRALQPHVLFGPKVKLAFDAGGAGWVPPPLKLLPAPVAEEKRTASPEPLVKADPPAATVPAPSVTPEENPTKSPESPKKRKASLRHRIGRRLSNAGSASSKFVADGPTRMPPLTRYCRCKRD
jgi:hypothetical protein